MESLLSNQTFKVSVLKTIDGNKNLIGKKSLKIQKVRNFLYKLCSEWTNKQKFKFQNTDPIVFPLIARRCSGMITDSFDRIVHN